jgi:uroporphyrinogen decarboxylase
MVPGTNPKGLKEDFGEKITFFGGLDEQSILPMARPKEVSDEVIRLIEVLGRGGGYILGPSHAIQPDTPLENIMAIYSTVLSSSLPQK